MKMNATITTFYWLLFFYYTLALIISEPDWYTIIWIILCFASWKLIPLIDPKKRKGETEFQE